MRPERGGHSTSNVLLRISSGSTFPSAAQAATSLPLLSRTVPSSASAPGGRAIPLSSSNSRRAHARLVFPDPHGRPWDDERVRNWRKRVFAPAADAAGVPDARPYDLRHSFVSLLIYDGASVLDVARQAGHAPTMTLDTYGHIFDELAETDRIPPKTSSLRRARVEAPGRWCCAPSARPS
jgi:hypothetical protein